MYEPFYSIDGACAGVRDEKGAWIFKNGARWDDFLVWQSMQKTPLDLSDRAPYPVPEDSDKSPLDGFLSKADAGTLTQKDINEAVVRMARRLRKGL